MSYAEKRNGKLTGRWFGEVVVKDKRFRRAFEMKKHADGYEVYVKLMGEEPPSVTDDTTGHETGRTFKQVAKECKAAGGPNGKWKAGRDNSLLQRLEFCAGRFDRDDDFGVIGAVDIGNVKRATLQRIVQALEKRPGYEGRKVLTNSTINRYLNAAGAVMTFAVQSEYVEHKPDTPTQHEVSKARAILQSFDQEEAILSWMRANLTDGDTKAFLIEVLVTAGARRGEFFKLRPDQIENGYINFAEDQTKNDEQRGVWIGEDRARELRALVASGALPKAYQLLRDFKRAAKACGYPPNLVLHSLRHTRNTRLRKQGVDMKTRMKMLGQKSPKTNMRYDHVDQDDQLEAAKKVEQARGELRQNGQLVKFPVARSA